MMANDKDFVVNGPVVVGKDTKVTVGSITSGSVGYNIAGASYDGVSFDLTAQIPASTSYGLALNDDGTKMYILDRGADTIYQYSLSTAFDISTSSYDSVSFNVSSQESSPFGMSFNNDGTKLYVVGSATDSAYQYSLSTAFDLSTISYDSVSFNVASQATIPYDICFNNDGTKMYINDISTDTLYQYSLSTTFDLSTASYDSVNLNTTSEGTNLTSAAFNNDGTRVFISDGLSDNIKQYSLSTAFDLSTASYDSVSFNVASQTISPQKLVFNNDGTKMYLLSTGKSVYQYSTVIVTKTLDLSTGNYFNQTLTENTEFPLSNAGDVQAFQLEVTGGAVGYDLVSALYDSVSFSVSSYQTSPTSLFFKPDGSKMYTTGNSGDDIDEYTLSTPWDITTASHVQNFVVTSQDTYPAHVFFKPDGLKMFILGRAASAAYQYTLSTAWDISTASYDSVSFSVSSQGGAKAGLFFKPDGTALFVSDYSADTVYKYTLSTAWDLSTASYSGDSFSTAAQDGVAFGITFKPDGTKMYITGSTNGSVFEYALGTAWDITTASYTGVSLSVASEDTVPQGVFFKDNGTKMYMIGSTGDNIYQYSTASLTLTWPTSIKWFSGAAPSAPDDGETDVFTFTTDDGGTTYTGVKSIDNAS